MKTFSGNVLYEVTEEYVVVADDEADAEVKITKAAIEDLPPGIATIIDVTNITEVSHT